MSEYSAFVIKCISLFGNFFLKSLGTGVVKTISPNEEKRINKIFITILISLIFILNNSLKLKSQNNLESIVDQKKRIEFEIDFLNRNNYVSRSNDYIFFLREYESENELKWQINLLDTNLISTQDTTILLDRSYLLKNINSYGDSFYMLFKKNYSNDKKYLVIKYIPENRRIIYNEIEFPLSLKVKKILYYKTYYVFLSETKNSKNLISIYNNKNRQLNNIYEFMYYDKEITKISKIDSFSFQALISDNNSNGFKINSRRVYDLNGELKNTAKIELEDYSIIDTKFLDNKYTISLVGKKKSKEAIAVLFNEINGRKILNTKLHKFENIKSINKIISSKNSNKNKFRIGEVFLINSLTRKDDKILFTIESMKEDFNNDGFSNYQYKPFYNSYTGTYDRKINPRFGGYIHNYFMILSFNLNGDLENDFSKRTNKLQTFEKKTYLKYLFREDPYIAFYINKGKISLTQFFTEDGKENQEYYYDIKSLNNNKVLKTETNPEGTSFWYNNYFITYGVQNIISSDKVRKRVFFLNKFEIID